MAHLVSNAGGLQGEPAPLERQRIAQMLQAIAVEHARAMTASGQAELQRRCLAELREMYCSGSEDDRCADVPAKR